MSFVSMQVRILGKDYSVRCPEGEEKSLLGAAAEVERRMKLMRANAKSGSSIETMALITAINMAYELQAKESPLPADSRPTDPEQGKVVEGMHRKLDDLDAFND